MEKNKVWKIALIIICVLLVGALATSLGILAHKVKVFNTEMGAVYDGAFYQTLDGLGDMENKLKKVQVSNYNKTKKQLLQEVYVDCEVTAVNLARLNNEEFDTAKVIKFVNQLGGFSAYLAKKLPDENVTEAENQKLMKLTEVVSALEKAFSEAGNAVALGGNLYNTLSEGIQTLSGVYEAFDQTTVDYPEMIYDGPFSEGLLDREAKFLKDKNEVEESVSLEKIIALYGSGESEGEVSGAIPSYLYSIPDGSVEVSKVGGYIVEIARDSHEGEVNLTKEQALSTAKGFLENVGYNGLEAVWVSINGYMAYINFAFVKDGVIYYPDLIKVKISLVGGEILGLDAQNFLYNHVERTLKENLGDVNTITFKEGFEAVVKRRVIIPTEWNTEIEAYEVAGKYDDAFYYIYYDATTLEEIKVMRVIQDENQGELIV